MKNSIATLILALTTVASAQQALDAKSANAWYSGATVEGTTAQGQAFRAYHSPEGKVKASVDGTYLNEGTWTGRSDGAICVEWRDSSWGKSPCYWVKDVGDGYWSLERVDDSKNSTRVRRIEGNKYSM